MKLFISMLVLATSMTASAAEASKMPVEEAKKGLANVCSANPQCLKDIEQLNNDTTCQELREFLKSHGIVAVDGNGQEIDVEDIVDCKAN